MNRFYIFCSVLIAGTCSLSPASTPEPECTRIVNRELRQLGMGTYEKPLENVVRREIVGRGGTDFLREFDSVSQSVSVTEFFSTGTHILVLNPSTVFGGIEMKKLELNQMCQIRSLALAIGGTGIYIDNNVCNGMEESNRLTDHQARQSAIQSIAPRAAWTDSKFLIELVHRQCGFYKGDWALIEN